MQGWNGPVWNQTGARRLNEKISQRTGYHDQKTAVRRVPALFAQGQSEDRQAAQSRYLQVACGGREARTRRAIFQAALNPVVLVPPPVLCGAAIARQVRVSSLLDGLYKVEYGVNDAFGRSVMCMHDGKMLGGNSAFAHLGTYQQIGEEIAAEIITERHNDDPHYKPLMGTDVAAISVRGRADGNKIRFEGSAAPGPGALFWADLTRLDDEALPPVGTVGHGGIVNGLYSIHVRPLEGVDGGVSGRMLLLHGRLPRGA